MEIRNYDPKTLLKLTVEKTKWKEYKEEEDWQCFEEMTSILKKNRVVGEFLQLIYEHCRQFPITSPKIFIQEAVSEIVVNFSTEEILQTNSVVNHSMVKCHRVISCIFLRLFSFDSKKINGDNSENLINRCDYSFVFPHLFFLFDDS